MTYNGSILPIQRARPFQHRIIEVDTQVFGVQRDSGVTPFDIRSGLGDERTEVGPASPLDE